PSVNEILLRFWKYTEQHFRDPDGHHTSQVREYRLTIRTIRELYGTTPAREFGPLALKAVREQMVEAGLARLEVSRRVHLARRICRWAAGDELIPFEVYHRLTAVGGLQKGRTTARETEPVRPVAGEHVEATLPHLNRQTRGLVGFVRLT